MRPAVRLGSPCGDAHGAAAGLVLGRGHHQPPEDLAIQAAHRRGGDYAFRRAPDPHHRVHAASDDGCRNARRQIAIADQSDAGAGRANLLDQRRVTRSIEHDHHEILDVPFEAPRDRPKILARGRVETDLVLRAGPDDELLHVEIGGVQKPAAVRRRENRHGIGGARCTQVRALERVNRDVDCRQLPGVRAPTRREPDLLADEEHRRFVPLPFTDHNRAVDWHAVHARAHRLNGCLIGFAPVPKPHSVGAGNSRLFDDAEEFEGEVGIHA